MLLGAENSKGHDLFREDSSDFQPTADLPVTGTIDTATWQALLQHAPATAKWSATRSAPKSAKLRARRYEIPPRGGAGWQSFG